MFPTLLVNPTVHRSGILLRTRHYDFRTKIRKKTKPKSKLVYEKTLRNLILIAFSNTKKNGKFHKKNIYKNLMLNSNTGTGFQYCNDGKSGWLLCEHFLLMIFSVSWSKNTILYGKSCFRSRIPQTNTFFLHA